MAVCLKCNFFFPKCFKNDIIVLARFCILMSLLVFLFGSFHFFLIAYSILDFYEAKLAIKEPQVDIIISALTFTLGILGVFGVTYRNPLIIALCSINSAIFFMIYITYGCLTLTVSDFYNVYNPMMLGLVFISGGILIFCFGGSSIGLFLHSESEGFLEDAFTTNPTSYERRYETRANTQINE